MLNVVAVSGRMVERKLSERGGRGKIEGSEIARISRIFGFYAFLGIDTSAMEERGFYTAVPSIDVQRERERERDSLSPQVSFTDIVQRRFMVGKSRDSSTRCFDLGKLVSV